MSQETQGPWRVRMADSGLRVLITRLFIIAASNASLYLAYPWLVDWYHRAWARRLLIDGRGVRYTGTRMGLVGLWTKVWLLSVITLTLYWWIRGRSSVDRYLDSHLTWAEEQLG